MFLKYIIVLPSRSLISSLYISRYDACTRYLTVCSELSISSKICSKARGMTPFCSGGSGTPCMVKDFPHPVWPYAKTGMDLKNRKLVLSYFSCIPRNETIMVKLSVED